MLEDYALRFTAKKARRWSPARVANTALGAISFLALEAIGGAITINYGFHNAAIAILFVSAIIFMAGIPICYYAARCGVDIDLLTRGASFGYIGSTLTSLIYASFTFIFFALEAAIMAVALELLLSIPLLVGYFICSIVVIPLVTHGITFISRFQLWTQPVWIILQVLPFIFILYHDAGLVTDWQTFTGARGEVSSSTDSSFNIIYFGAAASVLFALIAQIGEQVDYLRFLPEKNRSNSRQWWLAMFLGGPGWVIIGGLKLFAGSFLAYLLIVNGVDAEDASDPARMYITAFNYVVSSPQLALALAGIFVLICQLKINVTNAYAGSIAWSNFFSRLTHSHPGRVVWLVFNVVIALTLMELGVYQAFEGTLGVYAIVALAWMFSLVADLVINKPLGLSPQQIEFKRAYLYDINPVGVGAMLVASIAGLVCYFGFLGENLQALSHIVTIFCALLLSPLIAWATAGKYYIARSSELSSDNDSNLRCVVCQNYYEVEDMARCPVYNGAICSLCCSLDARCGDSCKPAASLPQQVAHWASHLLPERLVSSVNHQFVQFTMLLLSVCTIMGALLAVIYNNMVTGNLAIDMVLSSTVWKIFFILSIVAGVIAWLFVLAHNSRVVAEEESRRQNRLLYEEITAHKITDAALQTAKENADAANNAKSRYISGISHELRTPLNAILGYAQLLSNDSRTPSWIQQPISVIKHGGEHLADLIEGLLDISKIEAGRIELQRNKVRLPDLLQMLESMFRVQAGQKNIAFAYQQISELPEFVVTDEKHLRQILINLLSNAIKFTLAGQVTLIASYRNQVARFSIIDTGVGIPEEDLQNIFKPFERVRKPGMPAVSGTGLGLTITKLLTEMMGGDLIISNNCHGGVTAVVQIMLATPAKVATEFESQKTIYGYAGEKKVVTVVDDDPAHRGLISDILTPLNFLVLEAGDAEQALVMHEDCQPDIYLLDISMPGMSGWEFSGVLRDQGYTEPIIMVSANAVEVSSERSDVDLEPLSDSVHLSKPIRIEPLLEMIGNQLQLEWYYEPNANRTDGINARAKDNSEITTAYTIEHIPADAIERLLKHAQIGYLSGLHNELRRLSDKNLIHPDLKEELISCVNRVDLTTLISRLNNIENAVE